MTAPPRPMSMTRPKLAPPEAPASAPVKNNAQDRRFLCSGEDCQPKSFLSFVSGQHLGSQSTPLAERNHRIAIAG